MYIIERPGEPTWGQRPPVWPQQPPTWPVIRRPHYPDCRLPARGSPLPTFVCRLP